MQFVPQTAAGAPERDALRGRISIVDDDRSIREALKGLMRSVRYDAEAFASAEEFLASGRLSDTACLILDIRLPGMSGLDLQDHLRIEQSSVPIIFITANADDPSRERALKGGAKEFLSKPVRRETLFEAIQSAIG